MQANVIFHQVNTVKRDYILTEENVVSNKSWYMKQTFKNDPKKPVYTRWSKLSKNFVWLILYLRISSNLFVYIYTLTAIAQPIHKWTMSAINTLFGSERQGGRNFVAFQPFSYSFVSLTLIPTHGEVRTFRDQNLSWSTPEVYDWIRARRLLLVVMSKPLVKNWSALRTTTFHQPSKHYFERLFDEKYQFINAEKWFVKRT